jgi:acyl carrier protein
VEVEVDTEQLYQEFKALLQSEFSIPESKITMDSALGADLDLDSLDLVSASLAIEDRWGIRMEDEDLAEVKTVRDALQWVEARLEPQS